MRLHLLSVLSLIVCIGASQPNFIFFLTDDQDLLLDSLDYMPRLTEFFSDGVRFLNAFATTPVCCPSRSSIHTGRYIHNTLVQNNTVAGGCAGPAWQQGPETQNVGYLLSQLGYKTSFAGKYLNMYGYPESGGTQHVPRGWDQWIGLVGNSVYYNYNLSINGANVRYNSTPDDYLPSVILNYTLQFIDDLEPDQPFFAFLSTPACHQPAAPELQYADLFPGVQSPRLPNWNVRKTDRHWFAADQGVFGMNSTSIAWSDFLYRRRLQTLQTVEDMLLSLEAKLEASGQADNTYWVFTSDHGYHLGMFGLALDKRTNYEQDLRVPFFIKGPNVRPANHTQTALNIDIVPTLVDLAGGQVPDFLDGLSLKPALIGERPRKPRAEGRGDKPNFQLHALEKGEVRKAREEEQQEQQAGEGKEREGREGEERVGEGEGEGEGDWEVDAGNRRPLFLVQYFGSSGLESGGNPGVCNKSQTFGSADWLEVDCFAQIQYQNPPFFPLTHVLPFCNCQDSANQTYACLREAQTSSQWVFCTFVTGEMEYYDLYADPYQLNNTASLLNPKWISSMKNVIDRFLACAGQNCSWLDYDRTIPRYW